MAPLRTKFNHTLHKINDKFKRQPGRSVHPQEHDATHVKQPRTLPTSGVLLPSGQATALTHDIGLSGLAGEQDSQLPRTAGSGSTMNVGQSSGHGFGVSAPESSMSVEFLDQQRVAMQAAAPAAGTLTNPIDLTGNSKFPADTILGNRNIIDLTSPPSPTSPHGQKRNWAGPSLPDSVDVDYAIGQKSKMYRTASKHQSNMAKPDSYGGSSSYPAPKEFGQQHFDDDSIIISEWRNGLSSESHSRSTQYQSEDDLAVFGEKMLAATCQQCSAPFFAAVDGVITRTKDILSGKGVLHSHLSCGKCNAVGCVACGVRKPQPGKELPYKRTVQGISLAWCCNEGRLFLIWSLCCGPEFHKLENPITSATFGRLLKGKLKGSKPESTSPGKAKEPPARALSKGTGYGGDEFPNPSGSLAIRWGAQLFQYGGSTVTTPEEKLLGPYFAALRVLLSSFADSSQQPGSSDKSPPSMIKFMLRRSPLLPKVAELLRNDSMEDMTVRKETYEPLLELIGSIGRHAPDVIYDDYVLYPREEQLLHFSSSASGSNAVSAGGSRPNQRGKGRQLEQGSSIVSIVENLARQCRHLNRVASGYMEELKSGDTSKMLALSRIICDLAAEHEAKQGLAGGHVRSTTLNSLVPAQPASTVLTRSKEAEKAREELKDLHRDASVMDLPDDQLSLNFKFTKEALEVKEAFAAQGRMKKLVAQIANLRTSLPEGIWVRHGSSRLDIMKVLMVGPKGTPYEHGLFEFDLFCPADFPNKPPSVYFRTTGGGKVRFNPNLYEEGKVCLSILGTWTGEAWSAAYSTLLQVLVSIHGMILVDQPWYNEPGRERTQNQTASKKYNTLIQQYTVQHAMMDWLNQRLAPAGPATSNMSNGPAVGNTPRAGNLPASPAAQATAASTPDSAKDDPIWGEIIRKHFAANGKAIIETVKKWKQPAEAKDLISNLQDALSQHGFL